MPGPYEKAPVCCRGWCAAADVVARCKSPIQVREATYRAMRATRLTDFTQLSTRASSSTACSRRHQGRLHTSRATSADDGALTTLVGQDLVMNAEASSEFLTIIRSTDWSRLSHVYARAEDRPRHLAVLAYSGDPQARARLVCSCFRQRRFEGEARSLLTPEELEQQHDVD